MQPFTDICSCSDVCVLLYLHRIFNEQKSEALEKINWEIWGKKSGSFLKAFLSVFFLLWSDTKTFVQKRKDLSFNYICKKCAGIKVKIFGKFKMKIHSVPGLKHIFITVSNFGTCRSLSLSQVVLKMRGVVLAKTWTKYSQNLDVEDELAE